MSWLHRRWSSEHRTCTWATRRRGVRGPRARPAVCKLVTAGDPGALPSGPRRACEAGAACCRAAAVLDCHVCSGGPGERRRASSAHAAAVARPLPESDSRRRSSPSTCARASDVRVRDRQSVGTVIPVAKRPLGRSPGAGADPRSRAARARGQRRCRRSCAFDGNLPLDEVCAGPRSTRLQPR